MTTLSLNHAKLGALSALLDCLQSPLNFETTQLWQMEVLSRIEPLFGVNKCAFSIPNTRGEDEDDPSRPQKWYLRNIDQKALEAHYYWQNEELNFIFPKDWQELGFRLGVYNRNMLWDQVDADWKETQYYHEWMIPHKAANLFAISDTTTRADIRCYTPTEGHRITENDIALGKLILPALRAGTRAEQAFRSTRLMLDSFIDRVPEAVIIFGRSGKPEHFNNSALALLENVPGATESLVAKCRDLALAMAGPRSSSLNGHYPVVFETGRRRWNLEATFAERTSFGERAPIIVTIVELPSLLRIPSRSPQEIFDLTDREWEVAQLLGRRFTNREVASELGTSEHTARHHTERVLSKMGLSSRRDVGALL